MKFNGHKNWNHWNVSLWLMDDDGLYRMCREFAFTARTLDDAANDILACLPTTHTPDGARYTFSSVRSAIRDLR